MTAGARVGPNTVVDRGALVAADADLENVLVFPGVTARGHLRDRVVLPG